MDLNATNPIRVARKTRGWSLRYTAHKMDVHLQALYLNECGCYPTVLPRIEDFLVKILKVEKEKLDKEYAAFVTHKRRVSGEQFSFPTMGLLNLKEPNGNPIISFRLNLELSRMGFAKLFCIQPTILYNLEQCLTQTVPAQFKSALSESKLPSKVLVELCTRYEDWCDMNG